MIYPPGLLLSPQQLLTITSQSMGARFAHGLPPELAQAYYSTYAQAAANEAKSMNDYNGMARPFRSMEAGTTATGRQISKQFVLRDLRQHLEPLARMPDAADFKRAQLRLCELARLAHLIANGPLPLPDPRVVVDWSVELLSGYRAYLDIMENPREVAAMQPHLQTLAKKLVAMKKTPKLLEKLEYADPVAEAEMVYPGGWGVLTRSDYHLSPYR
jgi:hypothetical protein